jgi:hypothetical protein
MFRAKSIARPMEGIKKMCMFVTELRLSEFELLRKSIDARLRTSTHTCAVIAKNQSTYALAPLKETQSGIYLN